MISPGFTKSLFFRLMGAFGLVILLGFSLVYIIANQATQNEFQFYMVRGQMVALQDVANQLASYYRTRGSWDGVETIFPGDANLPSGRGRMMGGGMMGTPGMWLADARGVIIAGLDSGRRGRSFSPTDLKNGLPIQVDGQVVGTLMAESGMMSAPVDPSSQNFLNQMNRSLLVAGILAALAALVAGFVLFRQITAPLNALTQATQKIAAGDLHSRAVVRGEDEVARLGRSFNAMAENLERSETARRNMLADVAHELRNPLGVIQSHLEAMLDGVFPAAPEQIASLHDETLLLARLVDDLRDLALADAGQQSLHRELTDLPALAARTVGAFQAQAAEYQIALTCEQATPMPPVSLDAQRIEQVLRNLISNALRYTPAGGKVRVKLGSNGKTARVEVTDTGPGIPPDALEHVFERFWRGDKSRSRALGGSGLGLAIAKQWIESHGGQIGVSNQVGGGTIEGTGGASPRPSGSTFWFTLPL